MALSNGVAQNAPGEEEVVAAPAPVVVEVVGGGGEKNPYPRLEV